MTNPARGPLLVFDFDHTVVEKNTDVEVQRLAPGGDIPSSSEMRGLAQDKGWTEFMGAVLGLLHDTGVTRQQVEDLMAGLELTPGMEELWRVAVDQLAATIIIISDSNSEFISHILAVRGLSGLVDGVFTNPASWSEQGKLTIAPYHHQEECPLSTANLCKHRVMEEYLASRRHQFSYVCYVGDGKNDFCPGLRLGKGDLFCVRKGFSLQKYIPTMQQKGHKIQADILYWDTALEILNSLKSLQ